MQQRYLKLLLHRIQLIQRLEDELIQIGGVKLLVLHRSDEDHLIQIGGMKLLVLHRTVEDQLIHIGVMS